MSHSEINLLLWFFFLDHLYPSTPPLPLCLVVAGGVRKKWLWKCSLTRLLFALSKALGFLISRLSYPVISPHGKRASFSWTDPCCEQVTQMEACCFIQKLLRFPDVEARCEYGDTLSLLLSSFFDHWKKWYSIWWPNAWFPMGMVDSHLSQLQLQKDSLCESNS